MRKRKLALSTGLVMAVILTAASGCASPRAVSGKPKVFESAEPDKGEKILKVALLQMSSFQFDQESNKLKGGKFCRKAKESGADIALFPEIWNIGYTAFDKKKAGAKEQWQQRAIRRDSEFVKFYQRLAKELDMAIGITYLEKYDGAAPRNSISLIDRRGKIVMTYAKVHTCDFMAMEAACSPGDDFYVCDLDTAKGGVKVGAMICYDREAPESARILMLKGAELILTPNACVLDNRRIAQFKTRAFENTMAVAMANYPKPKHNGRSTACDGRGDVIVKAGEDEGIFLANIDLEELRKWRGRTIWGNAYRRPHRYGELISDQVEEPFIRKNAFGEPFERSKR